MVKDPLQQIDGQALFAEIGKLISGAPLNVTRDIAVSILINSIRQGVALRKDAEACFDEIMRRAKGILLDGHYDSVTGKRRGVFPYTQVIAPPLHVEETKSFDPHG
jgi:hypothetical protein